MTRSLQAVVLVCAQCAESPSRHAQQHTDIGPQPGADDEIDWDEDENKGAPAPAGGAAAAAGEGRAANPVAVPNQKVDTQPAETSDLKVAGGEDAKPADTTAATSNAAAPEPAPGAEVPKQDFSIGIGKTDAEKEAEKRAARAKRFGITEDDEAKKLAERAKKFGLENNEAIVKGLDAALPERRAKRQREEKQGGAGRSAKRQTPDRRTEAAPKGAKPLGRILDDPTEKAKAEARAKRFQTAA